MTTRSEDPEFAEAIAKIFKTSPENSQRLISRESTMVEFKESFYQGGKTWEEYGKTIAAFANAKGGYLVFGVKNKPHELKGLKNSYFDEFDPAKLSEFLNKMFSPEINWSKHIHKVGDKIFGILHIEESHSKPVVAISSGSNHIKEAEIYYRYRGRSEKIKYPEIKKILEDIRKTEQLLWMKHLRTIASIGVENAAIFNPDNGIVSGKSGAFILDKSLLGRLKFIREGEFREVTGAPAIKVVGEANILAAGEFQGNSIVVERKPIRTKDIVESFLDQKRPDNPEDFIKEICHQPTGYLPIYYFCSLINMNSERILNLIQAEKSSQQGKKKLIERIECKDSYLTEDIQDTGSKSSVQKSNFKQLFIDHSMTDPEDERDLGKILSALRSLNVNEIDKDYIFPIMKKWYEVFWERGSTTRTNLYKAICHLDKQCFCSIQFYSANL